MIVDQDDYFIEVPSDTIERITGVRLEVFSDPASTTRNIRLQKLGNSFLPM